MTDAPTCDVHHGDCLDILPLLSGLDACVCDPPYHLTTEKRGGSGLASLNVLSPAGRARIGTGFMGKCYHPSTEVMTDTGWVNIQEVVAGKHRIATLNPDTRDVEFQGITANYKYEFDGNLMHVRHRSAEQCVTPNHNMVVSYDGGRTLRMVQPTEVNRCFHLFAQGNPIPGKRGDVTITTTRPFGNSGINITESRKYDEEPFFRLLGLFIGDGYTCNRVNDNPSNDFFGFAVKKLRKIGDVRTTLCALGIKFTETPGDPTHFYCYDFVLLGFLKRLGAAHAKHIPEWVFQYHAELLEFVYNGMMDTDGCRKNDGDDQEVYFTTSRQLADDFQRLCFHTGRSAISTYRPGGKRVVICGNETVAGPAYVLCVLQPGKRLYTDRAKAIREFPYSGDVHCVEVAKHHIILTRFNGKPVWSGNSWDGGDIAFQAETWRLVYDALKPGAYLLAFGGTRGWHRLACAIEDAGFEIRDTICYLFGSGFPKSLNVSKAIDKLAGAERKVTGINEDYLRRKPNGMKTSGANCYSYSQIQHETDARITAPATAEAIRWNGFGTALKPAHEPIIVARKPLIGTVVQNVLAHGTGVLNIDGCRIDGVKPDCANIAFGAWREMEGRSDRQSPGQTYDSTQGRWPANVVHDGSDEVEAAFAMYGEKNGGHYPKARGRGNISTSGHRGQMDLDEQHSDTGTASRFYYAAKAGKQDRAGSRHPTVKPISLMRWLIRLVTPPGGTVLDCFAGSGTTGEAARLEGVNCVLIEREIEYLADIRWRLGRRWSLKQRIAQEIAEAA